MWPQLLEKFDYIFIDSPPFLAVTDAAILSAQAEAVIMVIRSGFTRRDAAIQTIEQLNRADAHLLGIVLNQVKNNGSLYYYYGGQGGR